MNEPITQVQDRDHRIGQLEGIAGQLDLRLDGMEKRLDRIEQAVVEQGREINRRIDSLTRWLVGMQLASFLALGSLLFRILDKLP